MQKKVVFMGTPDFAVESLKRLLENNIEVAAVITAPDRPAGRGRKLKMSAVKQFAIANDIKVLQPTNLKDPEFIEELKSIQADLFVVVAFRMLPEVVWQMPPLGTINLHGSLLPDYRGAAPINWAVINGDKKTGVTTFFIEKEIDTGKIIDQAEIDIDSNDTAGDVHDHLMVKGADLLLSTVQNIFKDDVKPIDQSDRIHGKLKPAPKIFKDDCKIDWNNSATDIHNKIRGLSPYPTAWTELVNDDTKKSLKLFESRKVTTEKNNSGQIKEEDGKLFFGANDGWLEITQLQLEGKKRMNTSDFLKGFQITDWNLIS